MDAEKRDELMTVEDDVYHNIVELQRHEAIKTDDSQEANSGEKGDDGGPQFLKNLVTKIKKSSTHTPRVLLKSVRTRKLQMWTQTC